MCAGQQLVSVQFNPLPIEEHFRGIASDVHRVTPKENKVKRTREAVAEFLTTTATLPIRTTIVLICKIHV